MFAYNSRLVKFDVVQKSHEGGVLDETHVRRHEGGKLRWKIEERKKIENSSAHKYIANFLQQNKFEILMNNLNLTLGRWKNFLLHFSDLQFRVIHEI